MQDFQTVGRPALYAQRIGDEGTIAWDPRGIKAFDIDSGEAYRIQVTEGRDGEVFIALTFRDLLNRRHGIKVCKLDSVGNSAWTVKPLDISIDLFIPTYYMVSDTDGGVLVAWGTTTAAFSNTQMSYIQKIDFKGNLLWGEDGIRLGN